MQIALLQSYQINIFEYYLSVWFVCWVFLEQMNASFVWICVNNNDSKSDQCDVADVLIGCFQFI